jgi:hypothetical protein
MVLRIPIPVAIQYTDPSIRAQANAAFQSLGVDGMEAIVDFDNADHIVSVTFNIRGSDHVVYASNASKLSNFGKALGQSAPSSPLPLLGVKGILLG